jgi:hypothetical protein
MRVQSGNRTFTQDVTVMTPIDGGHRRETLKVTFNYLDVEAIDKFDIKTMQGTTDFLHAVVNRFDGLTDDATGEPVPYSEELRAQLCNMPHVRQAVCLKYFDSVSKAKAGN